MNGVAVCCSVPTSYPPGLPSGHKARKSILQRYFLLSTYRPSEEINAGNICLYLRLQTAADTPGPFRLCLRCWRPLLRNQRRFPSDVVISILGFVTAAYLKVF